MTSLTTNRSTRQPLLTRGFVMLAVADLAYFTADGIAILALPLHVTGPLGGSEAAAGLAFAAFAVSALLLRPFAGRLSDTRGRLPVMTAGALLAVIGLAVTAYADSLALVVAMRLVLGAGEALFFVASIAALADLAPPDRLGEAISYNSLGLYLGLTLGPAVGERLVRIGGFTTAWWGAAALAGLAAVVVRGIGETRADGRPPEPGPLLHRPAIAPSLGFLASIVAMGGFLAFAALHAEESGLGVTSLPLVVYGSTVVVGRLLFARYVDSVPPLRLGTLALLAIAAGLLVLALADSPLELGLGSWLTAMGVVFSTPAFFSAIFATAGPAERGAASGTASIALDLGLAGGPLLAGTVAASHGIPAAFVACAAVVLAGAAWTGALGRTRARSAARAQ